MRARGAEPAAPNMELAKAVAEVLEWLQTTPDTAGALLGLNGRTLAAMTQGIVPMRSLVIRFAQGVAKQAAHRTGAPEWWACPDSWLELAQYSKRRDGDDSMASGPSRRRTEIPLPEPPPDRNARPAAASRPESPATRVAPETKAADVYRAAYERLTWGESYVHVFWILDRDNKKHFQMNMPAEVDYLARAGQVKQDLRGLSQAQFERKYGRYRIDPGT